MTIIIDTPKRHIMKKVLFAVLLLAFPFYCHAQQWYIEEQPTDELKGTKGKVNITYYLTSYDYFTCVKGEWDSFTIRTMQIFDSQLMGFDGNSFNWCCDVKIGLYDSNSNLIKTYSNVRLKVSEKDDRVISLRNSEIAREVLYHLFNTNGYIRILIPHAYSEEDYEMRIPHFSYSEKK